MKRLLTFAGKLLLPLLFVQAAHGQTCDPTSFVNVKGCRIAYKNCPTTGTIPAACSLCNPSDPTSRVVTSVLEQTKSGLQVQYTCPNGAQQTLLPAVQLSNYTVTICP